MKKHFIHTIILVMVFWGGYSPVAALSAEDNQLFLEMINRIRRAPYDYAMNLGYAPDALIAKGILPQTTFEPYKTDSELTQVAVDGSESMVGEDIQESTEPPVYRFSASTGGVVSFFNFMSREAALNIVIDYIVKKELKENTFDYILSKDYAYAGVGISAGKMGSGNAWFVDIRLRSAERVSEIQMLNLINEVRYNPKNILDYLELNQKEAYEKNENIISSSIIRFNPLFFNNALSQSAQVLSSHVVNKTYQEYLSTTQSALERAEGYTGEAIQEYLLPVESLPEENGLSVYSLFLSLMRHELTCWPLSPVAFLNDFQDIGFGLSFLPGEKVDISVMSFVLGRNASSLAGDETGSDGSISIYGILFSDKDRNGLYSPGEEMVQKTVTVCVDDGYGVQQEIRRVETDNAGHFSLLLAAGQRYSFTAIIDGIRVDWDNDNIPIASDQFVKLFYDPAVVSNPATNPATMVP